MNLSCCHYHSFCLQLVRTSCGFVFNSSCRNIIDYRDNLATISQNIVIMFFWLSHSPNSMLLYTYVYVVTAYVASGLFKLKVHSLSVCSRVFVCVMCVLLGVSRCDLCISLLPPSLPSFFSLCSASKMPSIQVCSCSWRCLTTSRIRTTRRSCRDFMKSSWSSNILHMPLALIIVHLCCCCCCCCCCCVCVPTQCVCLDSSH